MAFCASTGENTRAPACRFTPVTVGRPHVERARTGGLQTVIARPRVVVLTWPNDLAQMPQTCDHPAHIPRGPEPHLIGQIIDHAALSGGPGVITVGAGPRL